MSADRIAPVPARVALALTARSLKVTAVLDPIQVVVLNAMGSASVEIVVNVGEDRYRAALNPKSVRKVQAAIRATGAGAVVVLLQGQLVAGRIDQAGILAPPRAPKGPSK